MTLNVLRLRCSEKNAKNFQRTSVLCVEIQSVLSIQDNRRSAGRFSVKTVQSQKG